MKRISRNWFCNFEKVDKKILQIKEEEMNLKFEENQFLNKNIIIKAEIEQEYIKSSGWQLQKGTTMAPENFTELLKQEK